MFTTFGQSQIVNVCDSGRACITTIGTDAKCYIKGKTVAGNEIYACAGVASSGVANTLITSITETGNPGVAFGSGTTAPTANDYNMETLITTLTATVTTDKYYDTTDNNYKLRADYTISNSTANDITISEFGKFAKFGTNATIGGSSGTAKLFMVLHETFEPITIAAGGQLLFRVEYIYPGDLSAAT